MKDEENDLKKYQTRKGVLERLFYWKYPSRKIEYHNFRYRNSGCCPVCKSTILGEYGSNHMFTDHRHTEVEIYYHCIFCGFYSLFSRTRGFDDISVYTTILHQFSLFDITSIVDDLKKINTLQKIISLQEFIIFLKSQEKEYEIYLPENIGKLDYNIIFICETISGFSYALKIANNIDIDNLNIEVIQYILYPEILWNEEKVKVVFSNEISMIFNFKEAHKIFSFIGRYNKKYPPFYEISEKMKKQMMIHNIKYYYDKRYFAGSKFDQYMGDITYNDEIIYSEK